MRIAANDISTRHLNWHCHGIKLQTTGLRKCTRSDTEPLVFWQQHSERCPMLSKLAELYLSMSSASVPVEAMLPTSDLIFNSKRRCWHQTSSIKFHSFIRHSLPAVFNDYFQLNNCIHSYDTRSSDKIHLFAADSSFDTKCIKFKGCLLWNSLPKNLTDISSHAIFKRELKTYMLQNFLWLQFLIFYFLYVCLCLCVFKLV